MRKHIRDRITLQVAEAIAAGFNTTQGMGECTKLTKSQVARGLRVLIDHHLIEKRQIYPGVPAKYVLVADLEEVRAMFDESAAAQRVVRRRTSADALLQAMGMQAPPLPQGIPRLVLMRG